MIGTRLTGSRLELGDTCEGALALPPSPVVGDRFATRGKAIHGFIDDARRYGRVDALARVAEEWRDECAGIDLDELGDFLGGWLASDFETEIAIAYDVARDTARRVPAKFGRIIGEVLPGEIPAVLDAVVWRPGRVKVTDWKTGFKLVETPATNPQPRFYGLAAARMPVTPYGPSTEADALVVQFGDEGERPITRRAHYDELELDAIAGHVRAVWEKVERARETVAAGKLSRLKLVEGSHCARCPALTRCPAAARSGQALVELKERTALAPKAEGEEPIPILTDDQAARGWVLLKAMRAAGDVMERALKAHAARKGITLPTGKVVRPITYDVDVLDTTKALALVDELGLDAAAIIAEAKLSKAALERVLGKKETKAFVEKLRERGGVDPVERTRYDEVKP